MYYLFYEITLFRSQNFKNEVKIELPTVILPALIRMLSLYLLIFKLIDQQISGSLMRFKPTVLFILFLSAVLWAQPETPKEEFRAAWIASVVNLDWPSSPYLSTEQQKAELIHLLDELKALNFNAVLFQVRSESDAYYDSPIEPWSYFLTGSQGTPPSPYYDPLQFAVEEAHKRGMELHAWFNPYRADRGSNYLKDPNHVTNQHPDWVLTVGTIKILDPGQAAVRDYIADVIMDVVNRYDIDGVHFDDYFYPYEPIGSQDQGTFQSEPRGFTNLGDWRRDNVNIFIDSVYTRIKAVKSHVKFGVSPFGIWKSGYPAGISGLSSYSAVYCDPLNWFQRGKIDYLTPQLYWAHGGNQDYAKLMKWWADSIGTYDRHFYPGQAAYRIPEFSNPYEIQRQIRANRANEVTGGNVMFRAKAGVLDNEEGFADSLRTDLYRNPAVPPRMNWLDNLEPNGVQNLAAGFSPDQGLAALVWDAPQEASDGDSAFFYGVYRFNHGDITQEDIENTENFEYLTGTNYFNLFANNVGETQYFVVTAFDRNFNESVISNVIEVAAPESPVPSFPGNNAVDIAKDVTLVWDYKHVTSLYTIEISTDETFPAAETLVWEEIDDTTFQPLILEGESLYFWRVKGYNPAGESEYSEVYSFTTGYPAEPELLFPEHTATNIVVNPELVWANKENATSYHIQLGVSRVFDEGTVSVDTVVTDTTLMIAGLDPNRVYWWRASAINDLGEGQWCEPFGFKTEIATDVDEEDNIPAEFDLAQNYPNPFNPETRITYSVPKEAEVSLKVYDILGREVASVVDQYQYAGTYTVSFNASELSSGVYIYRLTAGDFTAQKKLVVMK